ncbi:K02A2.6-like [Cordylochernes scorpioides]|uniref:K02A2.6-like n=1 Tax=Cordylochernes scorpioides TaxID=51811 RepID=A0ABY6L6U9_9ARAC|nr:K02A2.6-like [Cordylochernes scorpioides]
MDKLKQALSSPPMLAHPDPGEQLILDTDASNTGIGAVLSQTQDGVERVIAYFKHAALRWLLNFKSPEGQLARRIQRLQEYDMEFQHRKGKPPGNADALSRRPCPVNCKHCSKAETQVELNIRQLALAEELKSDEWSSEEMRKAQLEDADLRPVMNWLKSGTNKPACTNAEQKPSTSQGVTSGGDAGLDRMLFNSSLKIENYDGNCDPRQCIESLKEMRFFYQWADYIIARYAAMNLLVELYGEKCMDVKTCGSGAGRFLRAEKTFTTSSGQGGRICRNQRVVQTVSLRPKFDPRGFLRNQEPNFGRRSTVCTTLTRTNSPKRVRG